MLLDEESKSQRRIVGEPSIASVYSGDGSHFNIAESLISMRQKGVNSMQAWLLAAGIHARTFFLQTFTSSRTISNLLPPGLVPSCFYESYGCKPEEKRGLGERIASSMARAHMNQKLVRVLEPMPTEVKCKEQKRISSGLMCQYL
jgi:hypothetical protein